MALSLPLSPAQSPSPRSGRSSPQASPFNKRLYDLKPAVVTASNTQVQTPALQKHPELWVNLARLVRLAEVTPLVHMLMEVHSSAGEVDTELAEFCKSLLQRVAELMSHAPLRGLGLVTELLQLFAERSEQLPALRPTNLFPLPEQRLEHFLHVSGRFVEARLDQWRAQNPGSIGEELDHLILCYHHGSNLQCLGFASPKISKIALEQLVQLIGQTPIEELHRRCASLLKPEEEVVKEAMAARLRAAKIRGKNSAELRGFVRALLSLHETLGLEKLDSSTEDSLSAELTGLFKAWSVERLLLEFDAQSGPAQLCRTSELLQRRSQEELAERLLNWLLGVVASLRHSKDIPKAKADTSHWRKVAHKGIAVGVLKFSELHRESAIDAFGSLYDECLSSEAMRPHAGEVDTLLFQVAIAMGAECKANGTLPAIVK